MITQILMQSIYQMEDRLRTCERLFEHSCVVSCVTTAEELPDNANWLRTFFGDIWMSDEEMEAFVASLPEDLKQNVFDERHANNIIDFVLAQHAKPESMTLFVNCEMGVSRSGAVATVVREMVGISPGQFAIYNTRCAPNPQILRVMRAVATKRKLLPV